MKAIDARGTLPKWTRWVDFELYASLLGYRLGLRCGLSDFCRWWGFEMMVGPWSAQLGYALYQNRWFFQHGTHYLR